MICQKKTPRHEALALSDGVCLLAKRESGGWQDVGHQRPDAAGHNRRAASGIEYSSKGGELIWSNRFTIPYGFLSIKEKKSPGFESGAMRHTAVRGVSKKKPAELISAPLHIIRISSPRMTSDGSDSSVK